MMHRSSSGRQTLPPCGTSHPLLGACGPQPWGLAELRGAQVAWACPQGQRRQSMNQNSVPAREEGTLNKCRHLGSTLNLNEAWSWVLEVSFVKAHC